jgi:hypothetical protein
MRPILFVAFAAALFLASCDQESDFAVAKQQSPYSVTIGSGAFGDVVAPNAIPAGDDVVQLNRDYCIEVSSTNWLTGFGERIPVKPNEPQTSDPFRGPRGIYSIEASGEGFCEEFARSKTELKLIYNARTNHVEGKLITHFYDGQELEQYFEGVANVSQQHPSLLLRIDILKGELRTADENMRMVKGQIIISIPEKPEGALKSNVYTIGMYCTGDVN